MAKSSTPDSRRFLDGGIMSSWDFPSVIKMPILGTPLLDPASGLKLFSKMKFRARPGGKKHKPNISN